MRFGCGGKGGVGGWNGDFAYQECIEREANEPHLTFCIKQPDRTLTQLLVKSEQHLLPVAKLGPASGIGIIRRGNGDLFEHQGEEHAHVGVRFYEVPELSDGGVANLAGEVLLLAHLLDCALEEAVPGERVGGHPSAETVFEVGAVGFEVEVDASGADAEVDCEGHGWGGEMGWVSLVG